MFFFVVVVVVVFIMVHFEGLVKIMDSLFRKMHVRKKLTESSIRFEVVQKLPRTDS